MARIVFDLDGTLIDSAPDIHAIANMLLADEGKEPITAEMSASFVGHGAAVYIERLRAARGIGDGAQQRLLNGFVARYSTTFDLTRPYPGVEAALLTLTDEGHTLGICTNKPIAATVAVLRHLDLARFFQTVWGGDSLEARKPDPRPLFSAFEALGGGGLYVGDSEVDAETAERAGVPFLLYTEGYRHAPIDTLPHTAAFSDWNDLPRLVAAHWRG